MRKIKILDLFDVTFQDYPENDKKTAVVLTVIGCDNGCPKCHSQELSNVKYIYRDESKFKYEKILSVTTFTLLKLLIKNAIISNRGWLRFVIQGGDPMTSTTEIRNSNFFINFFNLISNTINDIEKKVNNKYIEEIICELALIHPKITRNDLYNILKNMEFCIYTGKTLEYCFENFFKKLKPLHCIKYLKTGRYDHTQSQSSKKTNDEFILGSKNQKMYKVTYTNNGFEFTLLSDGGIIKYKNKVNERVSIDDKKVSFIKKLFNIFKKRS